MMRPSESEHQSAAQPRRALQLPEQLPCEPLPRQLPPPLLRESRPDPWALPGAPETDTLTLPLDVTRPLAPLPEITPLLIHTPNWWFPHRPLRVNTDTLHEPSNGAACAVEASERVEAASAAIKARERMEE